MTDDELERAILALPLEEPPAGLRRRILAATVARTAVAPTFRPWELWLLAAALVVVAAVTYALLVTTPDAGSRISTAIVSGLHAAGLFSIRTYAWLVVGCSTAWTISRLPFMSPATRRVYNR
jgi:hypothetical protein